MRQLPVAYQPHHITCEMSGFAEMKPMCPEPTYAALYSSVRARRSRRASLLLQGPRLVRRALCFCRVDHGLCPLSSSRCQPPAHHIQSIMPTVYYTTRPRKTANDAKLGLDEMLLLKGSDGFLKEISSGPSRICLRSGSHHCACGANKFATTRW